MANESYIPEYSKTMAKGLGIMAVAVLGVVGLGMLAGTFIPFI